MVGRENSDDAGVFLLTDEIALVQTVDFFTPIVNDPYDFGRIAVANALSDIYAMGAEPVTALNIVCFPTKTMDLAYLREILRGGLDKLHEAGALLLGGHSVEDREIKYGMAVTGIARPEEVKTNSSARPGDALVLTKPIGTGILATALKGGLIGEDDFTEAVEWMATLNKTAAEVMKKYRVSACTDVTGFGLIGHALEMATASRVKIEIQAGKVPLLPGAYDMASIGMVPAGTYANRDFCSSKVEISESVDPVLVDLLADAQTSGGLLVALDAADAAKMVEELRGLGLSLAAEIGTVLKSDEPQVIIAP